MKERVYSEDAGPEEMVVLFKRGSKNIADDGAGTGAPDVEKRNAADESAVAADAK